MNPTRAAALFLIATFLAVPYSFGAQDANSKPAVEKAGAYDVNSARTPAFRPPADEKKARLWALACGGVLMERNGSRHDTLDIGGFSKSNVTTWKKSLKKWWDVENRGDLIVTLGWVENGGHRASFAADAKYIAEGHTGFLDKLRENNSKDRASELRVVREYYKQLGDKGILGWDLSRYICLCRWGYTVGYLTEDEAWEKIMPVARLLQKKFGSWKELGENYIIGRQYWGGGVNEQPLYDDALMRLLESKNSPWVTLPWNTDLGQGPVMGEPKGGKTSSGPYASSTAIEGNYRTYRGEE